MEHTPGAFYREGVWNIINESSDKHPGFKKRLGFYSLALMPFISIPILGYHFYFRHDDSAWLLWAKEFTGSLHHIFSMNPEVNGTINFSMAIYYRPFANLYIKTVWHLFGVRPEPYHVVGGLFFIAAVYFLFRFVWRRTGISEAVVSCLALFVAFHGTMYNLFHIGVPVIFFSQMGMIYFFWSYLKRPHWLSMTGMILFLGPAMVRQTTPVILIAILILFIIEKRRVKIFLSPKYLPVLLLLACGFYLTSLSSLASKGSIMAVVPDWAKVLEFLKVRFFYYGSILTRGITGFLMLFMFTGGVLHHISRFIHKKWSRLLPVWICFLVSFLLTLVFLQLHAPAIYWLVFCLIILFIFDEPLRLPIGWACASLLSFLAVAYYHNGYLLEAGFPLAVALGMLTVRLVGPVMSEFRKRAPNLYRKVSGITVGVAIIGLVVVIMLGERLPVLGERIRVVKIATNSNRNFKHLMDYLHRELPRGVVVYELSEEYLGTGQTERPHLSMRNRAERVKIMSIEDKRFMLKVLDRDDIILRQFPREMGALADKNGYFIAVNNFERNIAENIAEGEFHLDLIKEFGGSYDSAAIYHIRILKEDLNTYPDHIGRAVNNSN
jgi:hypothetical protein